MSKQMNSAEIVDYLKQRSLEFVKVGLFDVDGVMRGKYMCVDKFIESLDKGFAFCDVVLGWDSSDKLYDNVDITGWEKGYGDAQVRILPETMRLIPFENDLPLFLVEFTEKHEAVCPRGTLKRVLALAEKLGYEVSTAAEFEFFVFDETPHSVREKNYKNLSNITPGNFGYSVLRSTTESDFYHKLLSMTKAMDMEIESLHTETGPGVIEAAIRVDSALKSADKAALFKTFTKVLAQQNNRMATFMAKWSPDWPGQSGHIHISMRQKNGDSVFFDAEKPNNMSDEMRWFIGGQQALMPELLAMVACTVNSYTRLIPGFWAPTDASWGIENRTCALRAILGSEFSQRVEYRISAADINPYIAMAAAIGSGLWGIQNKIEPDAPVEGNSYDKEFPPELKLPRTLMEAAQRLRASSVARELFGDAFVDHYASTREWEEREARGAITDWQLERYFEVI